MVSALAKHTHTHPRKNRGGVWWGEAVDMLSMVDKVSLMVKVICKQEL